MSPRKQSQPEPVRQAQVNRLATLILDEDFQQRLIATGRIPTSRPHARAKATLDAALRNSTDAEIHAARQIARKKGWTRR